MIKTQHREGKYSTVFVCHVCHQQITDDMAISIDRDKPTDGEYSDVLHVHKGDCDKAALERLGDIGSGWQEITHHILYLTRSINVPVEDLKQIKDELNELGFGSIG